MARIWSAASIAASKREAELAALESAAAAGRFADRFAGVAVSGPSLFGPVSRRTGKRHGAAAPSLARRAY